MRASAPPCASMRANARLCVDARAGARNGGSEGQSDPEMARSRPGLGPSSEHRDPGASRGSDHGTADAMCGPEMVRRYAQVFPGLRRFSLRTRGRTKGASRAHPQRVAPRRSERTHGNHPQERPRPVGPFWKTTHAKDPRGGFKPLLGNSSHDEYRRSGPRRIQQECNGV